MVHRVIIDAALLAYLICQGLIVLLACMQYEIKRCANFKGKDSLLTILDVGQMMRTGFPWKVPSGN